MLVAPNTPAMMITAAKAMVVLAYFKLSPPRLVINRVIMSGSLLAIESENDLLTCGFIQAIAAGKNTKENNQAIATPNALNNPIYLNGGI